MAAVAEVNSTTPTPLIRGLDKHAVNQASSVSMGIDGASNEGSGGHQLMNN